MLKEKEIDEKRVVVIGAGMVGVCAAWHLQRKGFKVLLVDRKDPGEETSWGNAGLFQVECLKPYPIPTGVLNRAKIALNMKNDVRYDALSIPECLYSIYLYWRNSSPRLYEQNCREHATLVRHCLTEHDVLIKASGCGDLVRRVGFLEMFRTKPEAEIRESVTDQKSQGIAVEYVSREDLRKLEPCIDVDQFIGGYHYTEPWQITDPGGAVKSYADHFVKSGGSFLKAQVHKIAPNPEGGWKISMDSGTLDTPLVVVAAGPWSNEVLKPLGYKFPLIPLRGYNTHFKIGDGAKLNHSFVDLENAMVLGPMRQGVRLTTGGEVATLSTPPNTVQIDASEKIARTILPLQERVSGVWHGYRPLMADMKPIIGEAPKHPGLWMCFGHGYQGFTLGAISGRLVAELMAKESPIVDPAPFSVERFS